MLQIYVPGVDGWDEAKEEFVPVVPGTNIVLEHSLISILHTRTSPQSSCTCRYQSMQEGSA